MVLLYDLAIRLYVFAIRLSAAFGNDKAKKWIDGRSNWREQFHALKSGENRVWFHCSSLGEFEQGRPVMEKLKTLRPDLKIVLTFFSPSGYEVRKNYQGADYIYYLPADSKRNASDFISAVNPQLVFFTKYEYWHHYFDGLRECKIPLYMVSAIFREGDRFFSWYGGFFRNMLKCVTHFFVQDKFSAELLGKIGFTNCTVAGDTRFDRVVELWRNNKEIPVAQQFSYGIPVMVAGSTWDADEKLLAAMLPAAGNKMRLIVAPHEISESRISEVQKTFGAFKVVRFSGVQNGKSNDADVLVIDNIGMLSSLYRYGQFAYVGGGFGKGIHNTLEAAVYGIPVFFGARFEKFREAKDLMACGGAFTVSTAAELTALVMKFLDDEKARAGAGAAAGSYVMANAGATEKLLRVVFPKDLNEDNK